MFGMGGSEILVILIVALLFLGPDKLPEAAKTISKGIRDLKKQSRALQETIENDEHIGGAIRDLKSALRGDEIPVRPPVRKEPPKTAEEAAAVAAPAPQNTIASAATDPSIDAGWDTSKPEAAPIEAAKSAPIDAAPVAAAKPMVTLPATAGEAADVPTDDAREDLAAMIRPAPGTVAKGSESTPEPEPKQKHG